MIDLLYSGCAYKRHLGNTHRLIAPLSTYHRYFQKSKIMAEYWKGTEGYRPINVYRQPFRDSHKLITEAVLAEFDLLNPNAKVLEIGAGLGELSNLHGDKWDHVYQSDPNKTAITENPARIKLSIDAKTIPFADESLDAVVGYSSLDVVSNLDTAMAEMHRVLKPGGELVHFLDIVPNPASLIEYEFSRGFFPAPNTDDSLLTYRRVGALSKAEIKNLLDILDSGSISYSDSFKIILRSPKLKYQMATSFAKQFPESTIAYWSETFADRMADTARDNGFTVIHNDYREGRTVIPRGLANLVLKLPDEADTLMNYSGFPLALGVLGVDAANLDQDEIYAISRMQVFVARKALM